MNRIKKQQRFYILCGNFTFNRGDQANLLSQIMLIRKYFPGSFISIDSLSPNVDKNWYPVNVVSRKGLFFPLKQVWTALLHDVVIWGGGALIADNSCRLIVPYWFVLIFIIKIIFRKKVIGWAHGVVLDTKTGNYFAKHLVHMIDDISVRDIGSYQLLHKILPNKLIQITADPAILIQPNSRSTGESILNTLGLKLNERPIVGLSFTFWPFYHHSKDWFPLVLSNRKTIIKKNKIEQLMQYQESIVRLSTFLIEKMNFNIVFVPRYVSLPWEDIALIQQIKEKIFSQQYIFVLSKQYHPLDLFSVWRCFNLHIGSALHDSIVALSCDVPSVHIAYEQKGRDLFQAFHIQDSLMSLEEFISAKHDELLHEIIRKTLNQNETNRVNLMYRKREIQHLAEKNILLLQKAVSRQACQ